MRDVIRQESNVYPLIISDLPINQLLDAIHAATGTPFVRVPDDQKSIERDAGDPLVAGEADGHSYLVDLSAAMIANMRSHLWKIASDFDCLIVASSYDRLESQCEFFATQNDKLLRLFWHNAKRTTKDYSVGEPLASESVVPLSNPDGSGLTAALRSFDFHQMDYAKGFRRVSGDFVVTWAGDVLELLKHDTLNQQINEHVRQNPNPNYNAPLPQVNVRPMDT